jgi:SRSO17 transposase
MAKRFLGFMESFSPLFISYRKDVSEKARHYLSGLMQAGTRKNMERMVEVVPESDHQAIHQFVSNSRWDTQAVLDRVSSNVDELIGDPKEACLLLDESGFVKKGKKSVGVARQWLGCVGKVDNGQVGVYAALCKGKEIALINTRLFEERSKEQLALEMVEDARRLNLRYGWIGADAGYGKGLGFMLQLDEMGEVFVTDIHTDQMIYEEEPCPYIPTGQGRGRRPSRFQVREKPVRVDKWVTRQPESSWRRVKIRRGTKGDLIYEVLTARVWLWKKGDATAHCWHLIVRRDAVRHNDYKYSLSNAPARTSRKRLGFMQGQRFWIERALEDAKSECGMADYQMRCWTGWHHHMALIMMAQLFMLTEKLHNKEQYPLLSCADIENLLARFLPRRDTDVEEVIQQLERRHKQRQAGINSAARKRRDAPALL